MRDIADEPPPFSTHQNPHITMLEHATCDALKLQPGKPPKHTTGYLAPSVGAFTLHGGKDGRGDAAFVWHHGCHLVIDWHHEALKFAGIATDEHGTKYWVYDVGDADGDVGDQDEKRPKMRIYFAQTRTNSSADGKGSHDEGYRIFYSLHEHLHLWAWDARTFGGHEHQH